MPARILFPDGNRSTDDTSSHSSPSDSYVNPALCREPPNRDSDDGEDTIILRSKPDSPSLEHSFLDDFVPHGFTSSELLAGSNVVLQTTASALNTTASVVRHMFSSSDSRNPTTEDTSAARHMFGSSNPATGNTARAPPKDDTPRTRADDQPRSSLRGDGVLPRDPPPTWEQFAEMQRKYAALQQQMDVLLARGSAEQQARSIDDEIEARRKAAYESAGLPYSPRARLPSTASSRESLSSSISRTTEYRISHKSIGYLRPAEASNKPFEAVDGEVYVRPLA